MMNLELLAHQVTLCPTRFGIHDSPQSCSAASVFPASGDDVLNVFSSVFVFSTPSHVKGSEIKRLKLIANMYIYHFNQF